MNSSMTWMDTVGLGVWLFVITIGLIGQLIPYDRPVMPLAPPPPPVVKLLDVDLAPVPDNIILTDDIASMPTELNSPPPLASLKAPPSAPPLTAVADPSGVSFALPVEGPVRVVDLSEASYFKPSHETEDFSADMPLIETIVFGQGNGRQPAPNYPWKAIKQGQEGSVSIVFCVDKDGCVISAEVGDPSPWPLLNQSALRAVLHRWRFPKGGIRYYEVVIEFELQK